MAAQFERRISRLEQENMETLGSKPRVEIVWTDFDDESSSDSLKIITGVPRIGDNGIEPIVLNWSNTIRVGWSKAS